MPTDEQIALIYVPCGSQEQAAAIASTLLSERLIACANLYASRSLYWWDGKVTDEDECMLLAKTLVSRSDEASKRIGELHSYTLPCILTIKVDSANPEFLEWVSNEVTIGMSHNSLKLAGEV